MSNTRFICVRYGNVLASRGSVIPLFHEQIRSRGARDHDHDRHDRFLLSLDLAVDTIFAAVGTGGGARPTSRASPPRGSWILPTYSSATGQFKSVVMASGPGRRSMRSWSPKKKRIARWSGTKYYAILPMLPELRESEEPCSPLTMSTARTGM